MRDLLLILVGMGLMHIFNFLFYLWIVLGNTEEDLEVSMGDIFIPVLTVVGLVSLYS